MLRIPAFKNQDYYINELKALEKIYWKSSASEWESLVQSAKYLNRKYFFEFKHPLLLILQNKSKQLKKERYANTEVLKEFKKLLHSTIHDNKQFVYKKGLED